MKKILLLALFAFLMLGTQTEAKAIEPQSEKCFYYKYMEVPKFISIFGYMVQVGTEMKHVRIEYNCPGSELGD